MADDVPILPMWPELRFQIAHREYATVYLTRPVTAKTLRRLIKMLEAQASVIEEDGDLSHVPPHPLTARGQAAPEGEPGPQVNEEEKP